MIYFFVGGIFQSGHFLGVFAVIRFAEICKYNSALCDLRVFHCISSIYHILMLFLEKYVTIKIKDHKNSQSNEYTFIEVRIFEETT